MTLSSRSQKSSTTICFVVIALIALSLRWGFVAKVVDPAAAGVTEHHVEDAKEYLILAENFALRGYYSDESTEAIGLFRTPGYPLFLAALRVAQLPGWTIFFVQSLINSLGVGCLFLLLDDLLGRRRLAIAASLLAAASPTSLSLSAMVLTDQLFATCFLVAFGLLSLSVRRSSLAWMSASSLAFCVSAYIKPTAFYWWPVGIFVAVCLAAAGRRSIRWGHVAIYVVIQLALLGSWMAHNYARHGTAKFCLIGEQTLVDYLGAKATMVARGEPDKVRQRQEELREYRREEAARGTPYPQVIAHQIDETLELLRANPRVALEVYLDNLFEEALVSCMYFEAQANLGTVGHLICHTERIVRRIALMCCAFGIVLIACEWYFASSGDARCRFLVGLSFAVTFCFFLALAGFTFSTGSRILYVAEFALLGLIAVVLPSVVWVLGPLGGILSWLTVRTSSNGEA